MKTLSLFVLLFIMTTSKILADHKLPKPDSHAPIGVMGDHLHLSDEYMISYRFMKMMLTIAQQMKTIITLHLNHLQTRTAIQEEQMIQLECI